MQDILRTSLRVHVGPTGRAKRGFDTKAEARLVAAELNTRPNASKRRPYNAYQCDMCQRWHVGRRPARRGRA